MHYFTARSYTVDGSDSCPFCRGVPPNLNFLELAVWVRQRKDHDAFTHFFSSLRGVCWEGGTRDYENIYYTRINYRKSSLQSVPLTEVCRTPSNDTKQIGCWNPPPANVYKLNIDGALFFDIKEAGIRAILRDSKGELVMAVNKKEKELVQPKTIECLAILGGLQFCLPLGITDLIVESDCQTLVAELQDPQASLSPLGNLFQDIKDLMGRFQLCSVHFTYSQSNEVAHLLAKYAWNVTYVVLWYGEVPDFLSQRVWVDKNCCNPVSFE